MVKTIIPLNTDKDGCCATLKANYYKMSPANFIGHSKDGFKAICIMEITNQSPVLCEVETTKSIWREEGVMDDINNV